jgi:hypothetical protein
MTDGRADRIAVALERIADELVETRKASGEQSERERKSIERMHREALAAQQTPHQHGDWTWAA